MIALILAQVLTMPTPVVIPTPEPSPSASLSERSILADRLDQIVAETKARTGGRLGVVVWDLGTNVLVQRNAESAFPLASVLKIPIAYAAYEAIDTGKLRADQEIAVLPTDLVGTVSPIADAYAGGPHAYTARELIDRMLLDSDNTAADVLYRVLGGADAINGSVRRMGIEAMVIRTDEAGNIADAKSGRSFAQGGDNAGSPAAVALLLAQLARDQVLSEASRRGLLEALSRVNTFPGRLRAGLPEHTWLAHKTGTSATFGGSVDATNDVGIANINHRHVVIVAMLQGARGTPAQRDAALAAVARAAYDATSLFPI